jgi:WD40 repeat protein
VTVAGVDAESAEPGENQEQQPSGRDLYGSPLPEHAVARLGTRHFRHGEGVSRIAYSDDGESIVAWDMSRALCVWDANTGALRRRAFFPQSYLLDLQYLDDGGSLVIFSARDGSGIHRWPFADSRVPPPEVVPGPSTVGAFGGQDQETFTHYTASPDGSMLVAASGGSAERLRFIRLWKHELDKPLEELQTTWSSDRTLGAMEWLGFSPFGQHVVAICRQEGDRGQTLEEYQNDEEERDAVVWLAATGEEVARYKVPRLGGNHPAVAVGATAAGDRLCIGTRMQLIHVYELLSGTELNRLEGHTGNVSALALSSDWKTLASGGWDNSVKLWDLTRGEKLAEARVNSWVESLAFSPDGQKLASAGQDNLIRLWSVPDLKPLHSDPGHEYLIWDIDLTKDGRFAATASWDGTLRIWEADTGKQVRVIEAQSEAGFGGVAFSPDGNYVTACDGNRMATWDVGTGEKKWEFAGSEDGMRFSSVRYADDGGLLVAVGGNVIFLWSPQEGLVEAPRELSPGRDGARITSACLTPNGKLLACATQTDMAASSMIHFWDVQSGELVRETQVQRGNVEYLEFSPDGKFLCSVGHSTKHGYVDRNVFIGSPDLGDSVKLWNVNTGEEVRRFAGDPDLNWGDIRYVHSVAFTPDGRFIMTAEHDGSVVVYDVHEGTRRARLEGHLGQVRSVAVSGDGRRLVSASSDLTGLVWDLTGILGQPDATR